MSFRQKKIQRSTSNMMPLDVLKTKEIKAEEATLILAQKKHERKLHYYDPNRRIIN